MFHSRGMENEIKRIYEIYLCIHASGNTPFSGHILGKYLQINKGINLFTVQSCRAEY